MFTVDGDYRFADMVIGGYGLGRGEELRSSGMVYGYAWQDPSQYRNRHLRWCTNRIEYTWENIEVENGNGRLDNNQDCVFGDCRIDLADPAAKPAIFSRRPCHQTGYMYNQRVRRKAVSV